MSAPSVPRFTYRAFISYSHHDKAWGDWLHKALETYRVPARLVGQETPRGLIPPRLAPVFRDREELATATDLSLEIDEALAQSECLIVVCSPASAVSRWVNEEILTYQRMGRGDRINCLIVAGEPAASTLPGRESEECFCPALLGVPNAQGAQSNRSTEPIAADVRPGGDGKVDAKLKLIAGMLGVGFDKLKQREQHRKIQRLAAIAVSALLATVLTTLLAAAALVARHDAMVAQASAERRQKHAEDLVGFMLGDLNTKLDQMQRLDIIRTVNDKAMAYFATLPPTDTSAVTLTQRAKALEQIGTVRMGSGDLAGALDAFQASTRISSALAVAAPDDSRSQVAYARTLAFIGMVHWKQDKLEEAQRDFETMHPTLQKLAAHKDSHPGVLFQLAMLDNNLGHVLEARDQAEAASWYYRERLALTQRLTALNPGNSDYMADIGAVHNDLGRLALQRGDLLSAIVEYRDNDAIETRLWLADRNDNLQRQNMLEARAILGRTLALAGADAEGTQHLADAVDISAELVRFEPANADFVLDQALYSSQLARLKRTGGDLPAANRLTANATGKLEAMLRKDPANTEWQKYAAEAMLEQAAQSFASGQVALAKAQAREVMQRLAPILDARPGDRNVQLLMAAATLQSATAASDPAEARALANKALQSMRAASTDSNDPRLLALHVQALLMLENGPQAQPLIARLWESGYRDAGLLGVLQGARIDYPPNTEFQARLLAVTRRNAQASASTQ